MLHARARTISTQSSRDCALRTCDACACVCVYKCNLDNGCANDDDEARYGYGIVQLAGVLMFCTHVRLCTHNKHCTGTATERMRVRKVMIARDGVLPQQTRSSLESIQTFSHVVPPPLNERAAAPVYAVMYAARARMHHKLDRPYPRNDRITVIYSYAYFSVACARARQAHN